MEMLKSTFLQSITFSNFIFKESKHFALAPFFQIKKVKVEQCLAPC
ncbi:hypothetical protein BACCIP111883_01217 [Sutcliffiella rhizosphaerae]|uniref:Uncharacterized protein n=1 Tax=Sutcliffiella rhizosphaerae TaxID=2880967 RepID=A0ABM8YKQ2_9BACI|nr:hypothetical protein BACCIP111883_01217 [Sutcliffiella rhizosphaerae]